MLPFTVAGSGSRRVKGKISCKIRCILFSSVFCLGIFPFSLLSGQMLWYVRLRVLVFVLIFKCLLCNFRSCGCLGTGIVRMKRYASRQRISLVLIVLCKCL